MFSTKFKAFVGTTLLVVGAFTVGNAVHQSLVVGAYPITSPAAVLGGLVGVVLIVAGHRLYLPMNEYIDTPSDRDEEKTTESSDGEAPEMSPLSDEDFENLEADDTR